MQRHIAHFLLLCALLCLVASCYDVEGEREVCDYKVLLRYDYNEENTSEGRNMIEYYVHSIDEYLFDEAGILFAQRRITPDFCREMLNSEWDLPPGRYSVIAIGNMDERSVPTDALTGNAPVVGATDRHNMRLTLSNCSGMPGNTYGESERLYHAYKTFTVKPEGISRVRVDMVNAHLALKFRITWKNNATPPKGDNYYVVLESVPSHYALMPEYIYPAGDWECRTHDCDTDDLYPDNCNSVIHHIPFTCYGEGGVALNSLTHRNDTKISVDKEMQAQFLSYRIKNNESKPLLHLYQKDGSVIKENIKLYRYFEHYEIDLDHTLKQEYNIDIIIDGDQVILTPLEIADYEEGGTIGGGMNGL